MTFVSMLHLHNVSRETLTSNGSNVGSIPMAGFSGKPEEREDNKHEKNKHLYYT